MDLRGERVLVTGGAGFIGSHVVDRLVEEGADVVAVDDLSVGKRENLAAAEQAGARLIMGDIRDHDFVKRCFADAAVVIHMACDNLRASIGHPMHTHDINATATLVTCLAAVEAGVSRYVYVSSSEAYGSARFLPMREDHPLEPTTVYGASKAAGELYAHGCMKTYGLPIIVVRPFNAYGPREHFEGTSAEVIPKFVSRILAGRPPVIHGSGTQTRDFTWVEETAAGIVAAAGCDDLIGEAVNIAHGRGVSIREICALLLEILDAQELQPQFDEPRPGDVDHHYADVTKARTVLGFEARISIRKGLERFTDWLTTGVRPERLRAEAPVRNW